MRLLFCVYVAVLLFNERSCGKEKGGGVKTIRKKESKLSTKTLSIYENLLMKCITTGRLAGFVCFSFVCCTIPTLTLTQTLALTL